MAFVPVKPKFVRSLYVAPSGLGEDPAMVGVFKLIYEFWGFCINGGDSLTVPGGFSTSHVTGSYINQAAGFESGSTVLLTSGSDGSTSVNAGSVFNALTSTPFSASVVGKYLVTWKSGSTSTDDSIYFIRKWINSSSIIVDATSGGTPTDVVSGSQPQFTTRSNVKYRVIDLQATRLLAGYTTGQNMVLQFNGAPDVNVGQANSQAKLAYEKNPNGGGGNLSNLSIVLSPSGSWDGNTTFVNESIGKIFPEVNSGPGSGGWVGATWFHGYDGNAVGYVTMIGDNTMLSTQIGGQWLGSAAAGWASTFTIEVPQRLYPQVNDPNPICAINIGNLGIYTWTQIGYGYAFRFFPSPYDSTLRRWPIMVRGYTGAYWHSTVSSNSMASLNTPRFPEIMFNPVSRKFLMTDGVLSMCRVNGQGDALGQFSMARARIRSARFCSQYYPYYMRVGDDNDKWIHIGGGVMWPWDHGVVSGRSMFPGV